MIDPAKRMLLSLVIVGVLASATRAQNADPPKPAPNSPDEPKAAKVSMAKAAEFLDAASLNWTNVKKCGTCHTNYPYLMARPLLKDTPMTGHDEVRKFFEDRIANWDRGERGDAPRWDAEVVATGVFLAMNDAQSTGKLNPLTRKALDRMWTLQLKNGSWDWLKCRWPPFEHDDYFGAVLVAVGVGQAPDNYANAESAQEGLKKLRTYLTRTSAPNLHHQAWLLWASVKLDGVMSKELREQTIQDLLALQRPDGGWSLPALGYWQGSDPKHVTDKNTSDGYATGLVIYVLRQAGLPANHEALQKGVKWLQTNQRESGRWFTRSINTERFHYLTHTGTAFAVLALKACETGAE